VRIYQILCSTGDTVHVQWATSADNARKKRQEMMRRFTLRTSDFSIRPLEIDTRKEGLVLFMNEHCTSVE
jgi:hypothetical protein